ncbi:DUF6241 domain-containing protein [Virgibacillus halodenitrificans]|uniref:Uncharacterized protein n=1 Tax=Virgibacillus halodenitrificans TaxID=1482 RepID=A0ABR7VIJ4_VIRHA|nr:DUF6241 domain-containing protein [Virgibacillus halodenitrificans]MBD1221516.1 hypothetical protein [Virgibacillus halodenitrificans]
MKSSNVVLAFFIIIFALWGCDENKKVKTSGDTEINNVSQKVDKEDIVNQKTVKNQDDNSTVQYFIEEKDFQKFAEKGLNPFGQEKKQINLSSTDFEYYIHGMTHQKVKAKEKWDFFEMHPKRIKWLLEGLEETKYKLGPDKQKYKNILKRWEQSDFSTIIEDHNFIWDENEGTVGKAIDRLSTEEERKFLEMEYEKKKHFK